MNQTASGRQYLMTVGVLWLLGRGIFNREVNEMKRDMDLVRKILLIMEENPEPTFGGNIEIEGVSEDEIHLHLRLMKEAGLIAAVDVSSHSGVYFIPQYITWGGYEFLDAARDDKRWNKAKGIAEKIASGTFDIMIKILTSLATDQLKGLLP
jgi:hypothetical protein